MKVLISNDDGVSAPGIVELNKALSEIAETVVVAPDRNRSGASSSLTLENPIRLNTLESNVHSISGTPADCIHIARQLVFNDELPDLVICGINVGANLGDDVIYSGTVAGAIEGCFLGVPAIAISLVNGRKEYMAGAAKIAREIINKNLPSLLGKHQIFNINIPDLPYTEIKGFRVTRQGHRHRDNVVVSSNDPRGKAIYWLGPPLAGNITTSGTDFQAIEEGFVSITPLTVDLTAYNAQEKIKAGVEELTL